MWLGQPQEHQYERRSNLLSAERMHCDLGLSLKMKLSWGLVHWPRGRHHGWERFDEAWGWKLCLWEPEVRLVLAENLSGPGRRGHDVMI